MAEPHDRLSVAFTEFAVSVLPDVKLPGVDAAHTTVRRRQRRRLAIVAACLTIVVVAPAALIALFRGPGHTGPDIGTTPTPTPSPSPSATAQPEGLRVIKDSNVRESTPLDNARLPIPSFEAQGCPEGETQYTGGIWRGAELLADPPTYVESRISALATGDVDRDGTVDVIAKATCRHGLIQGMDSNQLVVFTRLDDGPYRLLGPVFLAGGNYDVFQAEVDADGTIRAIVLGPLEPAGSAVVERHSFRWEGSVFAPVGSPVAVPDPGSTDLSLTVVPAPVSGSALVLIVTVHNAGTTSSDYLEFTFNAAAALAIRPEGFPVDLQPIDVQDNDCGEPVGCYWRVQTEPVAPGQSASGRFVVAFDGAVRDSLRVSVVGGTLGGWQNNVTDRNVVTVAIVAE